MATKNLARSLYVSRIESLRSVFSPQKCLDVQVGPLRWGGTTPRCFCSRRLLRVAARNRRPSLASVSHQRIQQSKNQIDRSPRKGQVTIDHKVWVSLSSFEGQGSNWFSVGGVGEREGGKN